MNCPTGLNRPFSGGKKCSCLNPFPLKFKELTLNLMHAYIIHCHKHHRTIDLLLVDKVKCNNGLDYCLDFCITYVIGTNEAELVITVKLGTVIHLVNLVTKLTIPTDSIEKVARLI